MIRRLATAMRDAANTLDPQPPAPLPRMVLTVTRSRRKTIDGVEWLPDSLDCEPLDPPLADAVLGRYDQLDLLHDVQAWDREGHRVVVEHTYHVRWREVHV